MQKCLATDHRKPGTRQPPLAEFRAEQLQKLEVWQSRDGSETGRGNQSAWFRNRNAQIDGRDRPAVRA